MNNKYLGKYRIESTRAQWWDYSRNGAYFITICTNNRDNFFGEIHDGKMNLSEIGKIADQYWLEIPDHFPGIFLDAHIIMPNHVHGILMIDKMGEFGERRIVQTPKLGVSTDASANDGSATDGSSTNSTTTDGITNGSSTDCTATDGTTNTTGLRTEKASQKWIPQSIGVIINQYKRICTIQSRKLNPDFAWQSLFHDHIIRNDQEFERIRNYILNNPAKWGMDSLKGGSVK